MLQQCGWISNTHTRPPNGNWNGNHLHANGDSQLGINQLLEKFEFYKDDLIPYHKNALQLLDKL